MTPDPDGSTRTTITLPRQLLRRLKVEAAERGTSMNEVVREVLETHVRASESARLRPVPRSLGRFDSGRTDTSQRASDLRPEFEPRSWRSS